jgi:tRNA (pseudouridine54-N1)-methyltransferase
LILLALGPPDGPKAIRISGRDVRRLNPDERSTVALLSRALDEDLPVSGFEVESTPGVHVSRRDLAAVLEIVDDGPLVLLDEAGALDGQDLPTNLAGADLTVVIGDDRGLTESQLDDVRSREAIVVTLGPVSLHADHCIAIVHNILDRANR